VIAYRAILDVPTELVRYVSRLLAAERGTRRGTRVLTCWYQALRRSKMRFGPVDCGFSVGQAACVYSLIRPPKTGLRRIHAVSRSATTTPGAPRSPSGTCCAMLWCGLAVL
jgi:hypothetical protein